MCFFLTHLTIDFLYKFFQNINLIFLMVFLLFYKLIWHFYSKINFFSKIKISYFFLEKSLMQGCIYLMQYSVKT